MRAAGVLSLLEDEDVAVQTYALQQLDQHVALFWAEIADALPRIEVLYEDAQFPSRQLAALVVSKVYYYLGELEESLNFALGAGNLFDVNNNQDQYVETVVCEFIGEVPYGL